MDAGQLELPFDSLFELGENPALWTPRDIWVRINQRLMSYFKEDRRIEYKRTRKVDFEDFATYLSTFSNTPDGGLVVFGADSHGMAEGCSNLAKDQLNNIEHCHTKYCPQSRPEFKRFEVVIGDKTDFCVAVYIPYVGRLVETNKQEAWIRYGDSRHKMSEEEKRDFRSTRQELSFEMETAPYSFPRDFDLRIIQDFCDQFRQKEGRRDWSNEDILVDRRLMQRDGAQIRTLNSLVILAARDPQRTIPGCRVRIQRFQSDTEGVGDNYNPIKDRIIEGNIVKLVSEAAEYIEDFIYDVTWLNKEGKFVTTKEYPKWAWFEALVNACVHRSYSFSGTEITVKFFPYRMEIESPGGFVPPVNEKTIYHTRSARNHNVMDALRFLGYVRMAREGTRRIRESMKEWDLPEPQFKQEALHGVVVRVTLLNDHETRKRATDRDVAQYFGVEVWRSLQLHEIQIVAYTFQNKMIQVSEAQRLTGRTWATSKKDLERLARKGFITFNPGEYVRDPKAHYVIAQKATRNA